MLLVVKSNSIDVIKTAGLWEFSRKKDADIAQLPSNPPDTELLPNIDGMPKFGP